MISKFGATMAGSVWAGANKLPKEKLMSEEHGCEAMRVLVSTIVLALVDSPNDVKVETATGERGLVVNVEVGAGDIGKVIGKQGRTARSLRLLVSAASTKMKLPCHLNIAMPKAEVLA